jgi:hypothetical protein
MRVLLVADLVLAAFGGAMTIAVGFVALVFAIYRGESARMAAGLPDVLTITGCFVLLTVLAVGAALLLRRRRTGHWLFQALLAAAIPYVWQTVVRHLQGA